MKFNLIFIMILFPLLLSAQQLENGVLEGKILNVKNNEPIPFANISIAGTNIGVLGDEEGNFIFRNVKPGYVELRVSSVGFKNYSSQPILVTNAKKVFVEVLMEESQVQLQEVVVQASSFRKKEESPLSLRRINIDEIERSPGSNRDISKVIQSLPGVSSTPAYRNDVIVRGGGASENRFYLDGVEIPNLNHFATQGASGGPVGIINVDFVREVNFYSGAFPANRGNALSSVLEFTQIDGNNEKTKFRGSVGASDMALTLDGPLTGNTSYIFSARRSYLQFLFKALELPFLPTYTDFQFKSRTKINAKNELTIIGLGAIDEFSLNTKANKTADQRYILSYLPVNEQWNYTLGFVYKHFRENSYDTWVFSRNMLDNTSFKYRNNIEADSLKTFDYESFEAENKFRFERNIQMSKGYKINFGASFEYARYFNSTYRLLFTGIPLQYETNLDLMRWGAFGQVSKSYLEEKLSLSLGVRADANNYSPEMRNLFDQLSPRFSASYALTPRLTVNFNTGRYFQAPPYTALGYRNETGKLVNKENKIKYINSDHLVAGFDFLPNPSSKFSIEGFYKMYNNYPFSVDDSIALASKGADFGTFGDEALLSVGKGRSYGVELLYQTKDLLGVNMIISYTMVRSEFEDKNKEYIPTAWDNKHIFNLTATREFKRNWDLGFKWRYVGGAPFTPYDLDRTSLASAWDAQGRAYLDYSRYNQLRSGPFHQLDIRVDKQYFFNKWSLRLYMDIQNLYNFKSDEPDRYVPAEDENGIRLPASGTPARYELSKIESDGSGTILPTVGVIVEF